uniref:Carbohydrate sulfotransferase n=1 Tax=Amphiprion percula TaxID=161767 RepID=A0A3P8U121_AMPPE
MRKPKVIRMVFALSLGCFVMVIFYFNSSLKPGEQKSRFTLIVCFHTPSSQPKYV